MERLSTESCSSHGLWSKIKRPGAVVISRIRGMRRGSIVVLSAAMMVFVIAMAAFTTDLGFITVSKTRQQAAVDAAVLAAIDVMVDGQVVSDAAISELLLANGYDPADSTLVVTTEYGSWDDTLHAFVVTSFENADAIRVQVRDNGIPAFFGPVLGHNGYSVVTEAIATKGNAIPRDIVLVLDCSTSMDANMSNGLTRMENAKDAAQSLVAELTNDDRASLAVFSWRDNSRNKHKKTGRPETDLSFNFTPTTDRVEDLEDGFYTSGTNVAGGLRAGLDVILNDPNPRLPPEVGDPDPVQIVVLLTDGKTNKKEPYPVPDDGPTGVLPPPPYGNNFNARTGVTKWSNTIKARGIKIHIVTLGSSSHDPLYVAAASPTENGVKYYHHVANGGNDAQNLLNVYKQIGQGNHGPKLVR
jgi:Mg-chelatase subunit ChlD